ncbi:3-methylitaconate isomerase [Variovorax sp. PBS-H4]|uniref:2-methylaconitate cis-trans isomerase PrpF family protein n=1 Tax=Variovorax sp. PBS-H4 TaxID=434008 RepID=UPI001316B34C|nr:PrpF domain-containing protein [Variovorax sp. PBS-H4]VTU36613.1 3-methylitaconate isomerase [Variovorax sp. PBS-H4]
MAEHLRLHRLPAVFARGGTSKGLMLHSRDLPDERAQWVPIFLAAMGSPDPYGRQLDGMGGGLSSLSKICVMGPPSRPDADVDYTFAQVLIKSSHVDFQPVCGNMSSAVGPFAVEEGLVEAQGESATVRIHNTNTGKIIVSTFALQEGRAAVEGALEIPGVAGTGAPVRLDFLDPGGASTGKLLPTGQARDMLDVPGMGRIEASLVDAGNACVFVRAAGLGLTGRESPMQIEEDLELMRKLGAIRIAASIRMGLAADEAEAASRTAVPFLGLVAPPADSTALSGEAIPADTMDLNARVLSNGQPHRALPLGVSLCLAVAARIEGTLAHEVCRPSDDPDADLRLGMPSGVLRVAAEARLHGQQWQVRRGSFYRTQRRLFEGHVLVPVPVSATFARVRA